MLYRPVKVKLEPVGKMLTPLRPWAPRSPGEILPFALICNTCEDDYFIELDEKKCPECGTLIVALYSRKEGGRLIYSHPDLSVSE